MGAERERIETEHQHKALWRRWGPYLSERQWGTVREDYSPHGTAWEYFPHDHARSRAYRWGEDGIGGISDNKQRLCFAPAFWNGRDPIIKERLFGLTGNQGNHGEDVKEYYFFLDNLPSHAYMKMLYRYPQAAYPYRELVDENARRTKADPEYELIDTGVLDEHRFFDATIEYAKAAPEEFLCRITIVNQGPETASLAVLPQVWFRNTWSWKPGSPRPVLIAENASPASSTVLISHDTLGDHRLYFENPQELLFTENETNYERVFGSPNATAYVKDGINDYIVEGKHDAVNPALAGTKAAAVYRMTLAPGASHQIRVRLCVDPHTDPFGDFDAVFDQRILEADAFYGELNDYPASPDEKMIQRQAFAGLLWNKQFYEYDVRDWLHGDPGQPPPPPERLHGRNADWTHLFSENVLSMPDNWEYPWFASWDLSFHCIAFSLIDPDFAKHQLLLLTREWYMHPNGQVPAYEWAFGDVNPPVMAGAALRIFRIEHRMSGNADYAFLEKVFQKLLLNFTWWVNRKDAQGRNVFQGGFLGLDNIGLFDRSAPLPGGGTLDQSDGTSWMGVYTLNMLAIALELSAKLPAYEDIASKFFNHFLLIADSMNKMGGEDQGLWDDVDGFYYDNLHVDGTIIPLRVRSVVGLIPLMAVEVFDTEQLSDLDEFAKQVHWFQANRPDLMANVAHMNEHAIDNRRLMAFVDRDRLERILHRMLDEAEFLSPGGIRALSRAYRTPYSVDLCGMKYGIDYEPGESTSGLFGGNSNWRGPVWFPVNFLLVEALQRYHYFYGDDFKVEFPTGSGRRLSLWDIASEISQRLIGIFTRDASNRRPVFGDNETFQTDPLWRDYVPFHEYFNGDTSAGLGASHQTGWTALVAKLIQQQSEYGASEKHPFDQA